MRVVAIDPGRTTGFAQGQIANGKMKVITGQHKFTHHELWLHLEWALPSVIICERFDYRKYARRGLDLYPRELIGAVELFCQSTDTTLHMQTPSQVMTYFTDKRLKGAGLYKVGKEHANDATRHLLYWFQFGPGYQYNEHGYESGAW